MTPEPTPASGRAGSGVFAFRSADQLSEKATPGPRIRHLFSTRRGGVSEPPYDSLNLGGGVGDNPAAVTANRERIADLADLPPAAVTWMNQVHGTTVLTVAGTAPPQPHPSAPAGCDGLVTDAVGVALAVLVADCVPMLAADPVAGVIGAVHAGRRGAADGIALRALEAMITAGARPGSVQVLLGPAICGDCYEVPAGMRDEVEAALPGSASVTGQGTPGLDLRAGLARQLRAAGVGSVDVDPRCTYTDLELFSHRRGAPTGRLAGLVWMPHRS